MRAVISGPRPPARKAPPYPRLRRKSRTWVKSRRRGRRARCVATCRASARASRRAPGRRLSRRSARVPPARRAPRGYGRPTPAPQPARWAGPATRRSPGDHGTWRNKPRARPTSRAAPRRGSPGMRRARDPSPTPTSDRSASSVHLEPSAGTEPLRDAGKKCAHVSAKPQGNVDRVEVLDHFCLVAAASVAFIPASRLAAAEGACRAVYCGAGRKRGMMRLSSDNRCLITPTRTNQSGECDDARASLPAAS
jgi:hypothetical protein